MVPLTLVNAVSTEIEMVERYPDTGGPAYVRYVLRCVVDAGTAEVVTSVPGDDAIANTPRSRLERLMLDDAALAAFTFGYGEVQAETGRRPLSREEYQRYHLDVTSDPWRPTRLEVLGDDIDGYGTTVGDVTVAAGLRGLTAVGVHYPSNMSSRLALTSWESFDEIHPDHV